MSDDEHTSPSTLLDVAREAGVSPSTVSRILNGTAKVSDDKRQAVMAAIARTKFAPNLMAQGLKRGRSQTIGIVVQDISSPYFDETLRGVDDGLKGTGYASVIVSGPADNIDAEERAAGYRRALSEAGIAVDPKLMVEGNFHENSGLLAVNHLFDTGQQFTAVFAANDQSAYGVRLCLYRKGIRVPDDVSLVGFDDLPGSSYTTPPLTTIRQPLYDMGLVATNALLRLIHGEPVQAQVPPLELVVRETTRRR